MRKVLYIGGTGEISTACIEASIARGDEVFTLNRGNSKGHPLVKQIDGDLRADNPYQQISDKHFDVVCQFMAFTPQDIERDVIFFTDRCSQYIFISSASVYQKPVKTPITTEQTPLENPFWQYAQLKIACEQKLVALAEQQRINYTIVRPSHTYRTRLPGAVINGYHQTWRMLNNQPIIVHGDGQSLWTLTYASDFANAFVKLFGNEKTLNDDFHITSSSAHSWQHILESVAGTLGVAPNIVPIAMDDLLRENPNWTGPLLGDKANSMVFDNSKLTNAIGDWHCEVDLSEGISKAAVFTLQFLETYAPDKTEDQLIDSLTRTYG